MTKKDIKADPLMDESLEVGQETSNKEEVEAEKPKTTKKVGVPKNSSRNETQRILDAQPKVNFIIPLSDGEKPGAYETVNINGIDGYKATIQKGVMVQIPLAVANLLAEKYRINMTVGEDIRVDRASDVVDALN